MASDQAHHLRQGELAEAIAATFLQAKGLTLLERNFHCRHGEIDLIMRHAKTLVFIEVRLRSHAQFGGAAMSINQAKQDKLRRSAEYYLQAHHDRYHDTACRFDAILMKDLDITAVEWIQNAF
jgi:putative endonuclease